MFLCPTSLLVRANTRYARIENTTEIFKNNSEDITIDNIICLAEKTYFVEIISDYENFYKVGYNGITGYIKKIDVREVSSTPITPYPYNIQLTINSNCNLRSTPTTKSTTSNVISTLYAGTNNITFIGRVSGEEAIDFGGNTWYYILYQGQYGYVYNNYIKSITPIYPNNETFTYAEPVSNKITNPITNTPTLIIVIILAIPLLVVLFILYLPYKPRTKSKRPKIIKEIERY